MKRTNYTIFALGTFAIVSNVRCADAQTVFFPNNAVINYALPGNSNSTAYIGYANFPDYSNRVNGTSPIIDFISGGFSQGVNVYNSSVVNMSGGSMEYFASLESSILNMSGGYIDNLTSALSSAVNISGGTTGYAVVAEDKSIININGGNITGSVDAYPNGTINIRGGNIASSSFSGLSVLDGGTLNLFGKDIAAKLVYSQYQSYNEYFLSGTLLDGSTLNNNRLFIYYGGHAKFTITNVPEPGSLALLVGLSTISAGVLRKRRLSPSAHKSLLRS